MAKKENIVSVLSFEKKLVPSDGYMYGTNWDNRGQVTPLKLREKSVRGTASHRMKEVTDKNIMKLNMNIADPNPQTVDSCALEPDQDTLKLHFTVKVLGGITQPSACNNAMFKQSYSVAAQNYIDTHGFTELARRYAQNIANARFLWRNRLGAEQIEVQVSAKNKSLHEEWVFDATQFSVREFKNNNDDINKLATCIASVLSSADDFVLLDIRCYVQMGRAQEVYPSEELVLDKGKGEKSKILYAVNGIAAMHSQKLGNALRTIDTWYPEFNDPEQSAGPIAIEPYGAVTNLGRAYRTPKDKQDFYSFFDTWARGESLSSVGDQHYVMAVLVRGGVFGESDK